MVDYLAVGVGGFFGAACRYLVGRAVAGFWRGDFPMGTFLVNMLGSFALGMLIAHPYFADRLLDGGVQTALGIGFMGSFTTFSTLMYESFMLTVRGKAWLGVVYVFISIITGLLLTWAALCLT